MKKNILLSGIFGFMMITAWSCKPSDTTDTTQKEPVVETPSRPIYPALGNQAIAELYSRADKVDIIFYNLPISVNQEDPKSVKNTALYVSPAAPNITADCKPLGRLSWMSEGVIIREADIYCEPGCEYLLFIEDNKPLAANAMVQAGVDFFKNIMSQVDKVKK
jgi:hypothetical protein